MSSTSRRFVLMFLVAFALCLGAGSTALAGEGHGDGHGDGDGGRSAVTVQHGFGCTIGIPENQLLTTTDSLYVAGPNGLAFESCYFHGSNQTPPAISGPASFPFACNVRGTPATYTSLMLLSNGDVILTCAVTPTRRG